MGYHSQFDEEPAILKFFGNFVGTFLDIGAYDGVNMSNTMALRKRGWRGVLVEPDPRSFTRLCANYAKAGPQPAVFICACIGTERKLVTFWHGDQGLSTTEVWHREARKRKGATYREMVASVVRPEELLAYAPSFDFVSIDVEGTNPDLLAIMPLKQMGTKLAVVEHQGEIATMCKHFAAQGLTEHVFLNHTNLIMGTPDGSWRI